MALYVDIMYLYKEFIPNIHKGDEKMILNRDGNQSFTRENEVKMISRFVNEGKKIYFSPNRKWIRINDVIFNGYDEQILVKIFGESIKNSFQ